MDTFAEGIRSEFRPPKLVYNPILCELLDKMTNPFISVLKGLEIFSSAGTPVIKVHEDEVVIDFVGGADLTEENFYTLDELDWVEDDAGVWHRWL